jgi:hypothetical protein
MKRSERANANPIGGYKLVGSADQAASLQAYIKASNPVVISQGTLQRVSHPAANPSKFHIVFDRPRSCAHIR